MRPKHLYVLGLLFFSFFLASCSEENRTDLPQNALSDLPISALGEKLETIESHVKPENDHFYDPSERRMTIKTGNKLFPEMDYYFDNKKQCQFIVIRANSFETLNGKQLKEELMKEGWQPKELAHAQKDKVEQYSKDGKLLLLFKHSTQAASQPTMLYTVDDQSSGSIYRFANNQDQDYGFWQPMTAFGMKKSIFSKYEMMYGHTVNEKRTNPKNGFYAYNTGNSKIPMVGYWYGETKKNNYLQECALYLDYNNPPTDAEIDKYVESLGFEKQRIFDADKNLYYYNWDEHVACMAHVRNPKNLPNTKFNPTLRFQKRPEIEQELPQRYVELPLISLMNNPATTFNKGKLDNYIEEYIKLGYVMTEVPAMPLPAVKKDGADFYLIFFLPGDNDTCAGLFLVSKGPKIVSSNDLYKKLSELGYVRYNKEMPLETYLNYDKDIQMQIDMKGTMEEMGMGYSIGINAIEDMFRQSNRPEHTSK